MPDNRKGRPDNMRPVRTTKEAKERGRNGGIKSGIARRKKRALRDAAQVLMDMPVTFKNVREQMQNLGFDEDDLTNQMAILVSMFKEAMAGNVKAAALFMEITGTGAAGLERAERLKMDKQRLDMEKKRLQMQVEGMLDSGDGMPTIINVRPEEDTLSYQDAPDHDEGDESD